MEKTLFFKDLMEQLPLAVIARLPGGTVYANQAARYTLNAIPATYAELSEQTPVLAEMLALPQDGEREHVELGGKHFWVHPMAYPNAGLTLLLMPYSLMETAQPGLKHLEQSYRDFQEIFRNSFDGIFVADGKGNTLMINEGCERNYDLNAEEMIGKNVEVFERKGLIKPVIASRVIAERQRITAVQRTHTGKTIMVTGIPLLDEKGKVRRVIINSRDTTELLKLQEELARAQDNLRRIESEVFELRRENLKFEGVVLNSPPMQRIAALVMRVAKVDTTLLITGESGVGKEVVAKLVHRQSSRCDGPFIKINCGAIPRELLESELFGYESGAFTGAHRQGKIGLIETANAGTLFLDEIGELPLDLQVKLLQVIQDRAFSRVGGTRTIEVDLRFIAATNIDLEDMIDKKRFRSDLYYRLNVVPFDIPPLRERQDDVFPLVHRCLEDFNSQYGLSKRISEPALQYLLAYNWPGNVRELRNIVERMVVTSPSDLIGVEDLPHQLRSESTRLEEPRLDYKTRVARFEASLIQEAVAKYGTTRAAAKQLNISQSTAVRKLRADPMRHS